MKSVDGGFSITNDYEKATNSAEICCPADMELVRLWPRGDKQVFVFIIVLIF